MFMRQRIKRYVMGVGLFIVRSGRGVNQARTRFLQLVDYEMNIMREIHTDTVLDCERKVA